MSVLSYIQINSELGCRRQKDARSHLHQRWQPEKFLEVSYSEAGPQSKLPVARPEFPAVFSRIKSSCAGSLTHPLIYIYIYIYVRVECQFLGERCCAMSRFSFPRNLETKSLACAILRPVPSSLLIGTSDSLANSSLPLATSHLTTSTRGLTPPGL